jgi:fumarylacetoacetase
MTQPVSWVPGAGAGEPFGIDHLPYGCARFGAEARARVVIRIGDFGLDLASACACLRPDLLPFVEGTVLNPLLAADVRVWAQLRAAITEWLTDEQYRERLTGLLMPVGELTMQLAIDVADYVDFYASQAHATNVGKILRPQTDPLPANWKSLPIGYHGRAGTVVVSGTPIRRPRGQWRAGTEVEFGPSTRLDFEAEVGFVLGGPTELGSPVPLADACDHIFGVCLLNDWSARDIQAWESTPLGPFLGKSFGTSVADWITPLAALAGAWGPPPPRDPVPLEYLDDAGRLDALALQLHISLNGEVISRPEFSVMYWTPAQLVTHLTVNGASIRAGDLLGSGTVSGSRRDQRGCLLELTWGGTEPLVLDSANGGDSANSRLFLADGDEVAITASAQGASGLLTLAEVRGRIVSSI